MFELLAFLVVAGIACGVVVLAVAAIKVVFQLVLLPLKLLVLPVAAIFFVVKMAVLVAVGVTVAAVAAAVIIPLLVVGAMVAVPLLLIGAVA